VKSYLDLAALAGALEDAGLQIGLKNLGEKSENVELDVRAGHSSILAAVGKNGKSLS
jgi:hypothetical protein